MRNRAKPTTLLAMIPTVVLLAAGMSTRFGRLKQLEPVGPGGEALLDYSVFDARRAGFSRILLIIREELEETFRNHIRGRWPEDLKVVFHHQRLDDLPGTGAAQNAPSALRVNADPGRPLSPAAAPTREAALSPDVVVGRREKPWGTAHAVLSARSHLPGPFVLLNADDFYGESAFRQAQEFLSAELPGESGDTPLFGLVTYTLQDTLSEYGGVSRGVCRVDAHGWLQGIQEVLEIRRGKEGISGRTVPGRKLALRGTEPISTNLWIFTPAIFPILEAGFVEFLRARQVEASPSQPEFLIPTEVSRGLEEESVRVRGIPTMDRFLGITHPQDREWVVRGLKELTVEGRYPSPLWS